TIEYVWDVKDAPGLTSEDSLPAWCDPDPWVQLSDFRTWTKVNQWALALFRVASPLSPELSGKITEWKRIRDRQQQILAVLRFVQDNVRYFGIEIGASAEKPANPSTVFARRYGDCKDKSLLFVTILRALGIGAYPVLVNATLQKGIEDWQPSAGAFDHCIAVVQSDGQSYWLDPTINYQGGPLAAHYLPDYGCGLVISPATTGLTVIPPSKDSACTTTTEYFQIGRYREPSSLKVVTVAEGGDADRLRALFATTKRSDVEKNYTHFHSAAYPGITMSAPIAVADDRQDNRIQTTEFYSIGNMWTRSASDGRYRCEFYPSGIAALLEAPVDTDRKFPLGIRFPDHRILRTEVTLAKAWPSSVERKVITNPAFTFRRSCRCEGNKLDMEYEYQSQADSVAPAQVSQYIQQLDQCSQSLGYGLIWSSRWR
ncbi:MAG: transglutaminase domain-containing protein, partial [Verrucomicrobia bacterium]|nr:transglutaminase domain-containing protein [Verrucomicrobiota bacterium]